MQDVKFESIFTLKDYRKVAYYNNYGRGLILPVGNILLLLFGLFNLIGSLWLDTYGLIATAVCILYPIGNFLYIRKKINDGIKLNKVPNETPQRMTIGENGVIFSRQDRFNHYRWDDIEHIYETKQYLLIYTDDARVLTLPKRDTDVDAIYHAKNFFTSQLPFKRYRLKK